MKNLFYGVIVAGILLSGTLHPIPLPTTSSKTRNPSFAHQALSAESLFSRIIMDNTATIEDVRAYVIGPHFDPEAHYWLHRTFNDLRSMIFWEYEYRTVQRGTAGLLEKWAALQAVVKSKMRLQEKVARNHFQPSMALPSLTDSNRQDLSPRNKTELHAALHQHGAIGLQFANSKVESVVDLENSLHIVHGHYYDDDQAFSMKKTRVLFDEENQRILEIQFRHGFRWETFWGPGVLDLAIRLTLEGPQLLFAVADRLVSDITMKIEQDHRLERFSYAVIGVEQAERESNRYGSLFRFLPRQTAIAA